MYRSKRILSLPLATLSVLFVSVFLFGATVSAQGAIEVLPVSQNELTIKNKRDKVDEKSTTLQSTSQELQALEERKKSLANQIEVEKQKIEDLKRKISQKKAAQKKAAQPKPVVVKPSVSTTTTTVTSGLRGGCGDNEYAAYIYGKESGGRVSGMCNTTARNAGGCLGIGQACPGSKIAHCGADYACQNAWFTNYAMQRYGSWAAAYSFHKANNWW